MKELAKLVIEFDGAGGRLVGEPINKAEPEAREKPISPKEMQETLRAVKKLALEIASAYVQRKSPPSELDDIKMYIRRKCIDAGYFRLAPIFIKEIEGEIEIKMARQRATEPTE